MGKTFVGAAPAAAAAASPKGASANKNKDGDDDGEKSSWDSSDNDDDSSSSGSSEDEEEGEKDDDDSYMDECYICDDGGDLICCDGPGCKKAYHAECVGVDINTLPLEWLCPTCVKAAAVLAAKAKKIMPAPKKAMPAAKLKAPPAKETVEKSVAMIKPTSYAMSQGESAIKASPKRGLTPIAKAKTPATSKKVERCMPIVLDLTGDSDDESERSNEGGGKACSDKPASSTVNQEASAATKAKEKAVTTTTIIDSAAVQDSTNHIAATIQKSATSNADTNIISTSKNDKDATNVATETPATTAPTITAPGKTKSLEGTEGGQQQKQHQQISLSQTLLSQKKDASTSQAHGAPPSTAAQKDDMATDAGAKTTVTSASTHPAANTTLPNTAEAAGNQTQEESHAKNLNDSSVLKGNLSRTNIGGNREHTQNAAGAQISDGNTKLANKASATAESVSNNTSIAQNQKQTESPSSQNRVTAGGAAAAAATVPAPSTSQPVANAISSPNTTQQPADAANSQPTNIADESTTPAPSELTYRTVIVPKGVKPGEVFHVVLGKGKMMGVICPKGVYPGNQLIVLEPGNYEPPIPPAAIAKMNAQKLLEGIHKEGQPFVVHAFWKVLWPALHLDGWTYKRQIHYDFGATTFYQPKVSEKMDKSQLLLNVHYFETIKGVMAFVAQIPSCAKMVRDCRLDIQNRKAEAAFRKEREEEELQNRRREAEEMQNRRLKEQEKASKGVTVVGTPQQKKRKEGATTMQGSRKRKKRTSVLETVVDLDSWKYLGERQHIQVGSQHQVRSIPRAGTCETGEGESYIQEKVFSDPSFSPSIITPAEWVDWAKDPTFADKFQKSLLDYKKRMPLLSKALDKPVGFCLWYYYHKFKIPKNAENYQRLKQMISELKEDKNSEECSICKKGGDLLCCDTCTDSYHLSCLDLTSADVEGMAKWSCPNCVRKRKFMLSPPKSPKKRHKADLDASHDENGNDPNLK